MNLILNGGALRTEVALSLICQVHCLNICTFRSVFLWPFMSKLDLSIMRWQVVSGCWDLILYAYSLHPSSFLCPTLFLWMISCTTIYYYGCWSIVQSIDSWNAGFYFLWPYCLNCPHVFYCLVSEHTLIISGVYNGMFRIGQLVKPCELNSCFF